MRAPPLRLLRSLSLAALACAPLACGGEPPPPAAPAPRAAKAPASEGGGHAEAAFVALKVDTSRTLKSGAKLGVPAGWWLRELAAGLAFQDPDRELTITLLELEADSTDEAAKRALAELQRTPPPKVARSFHELDQAGWDEVAETVWETPPSEQRVLALNLRRQGSRTWATLLEGKSSAFARRGAQVGQIVLGLEVPGVAPEDLSARAPLPLEGERRSAFEAFVESARDKTHVPGMAVAVVQSGKIVLERGFGVRERGKSEPVTERTRFMIGSVTKSLSTLLVASLVDSGKLTWDSRVKALLPTFTTGDADFTDKLTVAHTFCACTGMPRRDLDLVFEYGSRRPEDAFTAFASVKPTTGFGETFQYSNQMTALGGFLAARLAEPGKPVGPAFAAAMKSRVFAPMGMSDTTASYEEGKKGALALPHGGSLAGPRDEPMPLPLAMESFVVPVAPAGGVFSTAHDMARYALVELGKGRTPEGKQVFTEASVLERRRPYAKVGAKGTYGLGLASSVLRGIPIVTHDGGTFGFVTRFAFFPDKDLGFVVLTNTTSAGPALVDAVTQRLVELVFAGKEQSAKDLDRALEQDRAEWQRLHDRAAKSVPDDVVARVLGTWRQERLGAFTFAKTKDGVRLDVGEWSSRVGYDRAEDGTERLFLLDPPLGGLPLTVGSGRLSLELGQESYELAKR